MILHIKLFNYTLNISTDLHDNKSIQNTLTNSITLFVEEL